MKQVFLSFATQDGVSAQVLARLKHQSMIVWDYQTRGDSLPAGTSIERSVRTRIAEADLFVVLVTEPALHSTWVSLELQCAVERRDADPSFTIVPIVDRRLSDTQRKHPLLVMLRDILACYVSVNSLASVEDAVAQICEHLGVMHVPPVSEDPRLPFMDRIYQELRHCTAKSAYPSEAYQRVERLAVEFVGVFEAGRHAEANHVMRFLLATLRHEYPGELLFYPVIVLAVNLALLERYDEALASLLELRTTVAALEIADERYPMDCLPAAIGAIYYQMGDFRAAREEFRKAWTLSQKDAAIYMALLFARLRCNDELPIDVSAALAELPSAGLFAGDDEQIAINAAFALGLAGNVKDAVRRLRKLVGRRIHPPWLMSWCRQPRPSSNASSRRRLAEVLSGYADLLVADDRPDEAKSLLERALKDHPVAPELLVTLGDLCIQLKDPVTAAQHFWKLSETTSTNWKYQYTAMRGLVQSGAHDKACIIANGLLASNIQGLPQKPGEFFIVGAANWILGHSQRALYDLERSDEPGFNYRKYLGPCGEGL